MKKLSIRAVIMIIIILLFLGGLGIFLYNYFSLSAQWVMAPQNEHIYNNGQLIKAGKIYDATGIVLASTKNGKRVYNEDKSIRKSTLHAVGDKYGYISTGVQTTLTNTLTGYDFVNGLNAKSNNVKLTLDANVCADAYEAFGSYDGTVGICNYKTGELICMISKPSYDVNSKESTKNAVNGKYNATFLNRFISGTYTPGSTFKIVTATAVLENFKHPFDKTYYCEGGVHIDDRKVGCMGYHYNVSLTDAFAYSCNAYFCKAAIDLGDDVMMDYASKFGFNKKYELDGIKAKKSNYAVNDEADLNLAWSGMGQFTDLINPLQYLTSIGGIANNGLPVKPYFIKKVYNDDLTVYKAHKKTLKRICSKKTAKKVQGLMDSAVRINYGKDYFGSLDVCAKTGTAEVGKENSHAELVGFCKDSKYPFAFIVVVEEGESTKDIAKYVAKVALNSAKESYDDRD